MKRFALILAFFAFPAFADPVCHVLLNAATAPGPSSAVYSTVIGNGAETFFFFVNGDGRAVLEVSFDSGSTWIRYRAFSGMADLLLVPAAGGARFRVNVLTADAAHAVSAGSCVSGVLTATVTP
jgi:hypothetical protein